jgi:hypothetical protein
MAELKPWIKTLIVSLIQIVTYLLICEIALHIRQHFLSAKPDLGWGLLYRYSLGLLCVLVAFGNPISTFFFKGSRKSVWIVFVCSLFIFVTFVSMSGFQYTPYRSGLLLISALIALLIRVLKSKRRIKNF